MAKLTTTTISKRTVEALSVEKDTVFWDSELSGFGVRVYPTGSKFYVVQTRAGGKAGKRVTVGRHGIVTAEEARRRAALVIARIKAGEDPVPEPAALALAGGPTVGELARQWLEEHVEVRCKPRTVTMYTLIVEKHLLPAIGKISAPTLDHARVTELHHSLRGTPVMANQVVDTLSRIWNAAEDRGQLPEASNPCLHVVRNRERKRERFLGEEEFRRLGRTLAEAETCKGVSVHAVAAIRLLLLTGCRKNEILTLRWKDVDLEARELRLEDSKTGARTVPISPEVAEVLANIPRVEGNPHVIPGKLKGRHMRNLNDPWDLICERAKIANARLHDCRHSFASRALALGEGLPMIGKLLGHKQVETTARYAHLSRHSVRDSAVRVADSIAGDIIRDWQNGDRCSTAPP
ncbi:MAG: tyrosine-type recombinase/integrase [Boseongicola sp. SB0667_bin_21]|nr:tyrosine-type recombinase/integrase [Boseongicola sp. SB0667_bin_21]